jgi:cytochrome c biogenesis protein CcdA/glutaredoxin
MADKFKFYNLKNILILFVFAFLLICYFLPNYCLAKSHDKVIVHFFEQKNCGHCKAAKKFFSDLQKKNDNYELKSYLIHKKNNLEYFDHITEVFELARVTPLIVINNQAIIGFESPQTTGKAIEEIIQKNQGKKPMTIEQIINKKSEKDIYLPLNITVPFLGVIDLRNYSLPAFSLILGFIDGFNPCAMWVLVMFLTVLMQVGDRKKMIITAGIFILAEALMYYLILNVWYSVWNFIGLNKIVTPAVGIVALICALYFFYKYFVNKGECKLVSFEKRKQTKNRIFALSKKSFSVLTLLSILALAFSVNIIEFACSIGIPQTYTKVLDLNYAHWIVKQFYMFLYILAYMLDDLIVFSIALYSFEKIGLTQKYSRFSTLAGAILMLVLGLLLIFYPELLAFK